MQKRLSTCYADAIRILQDNRTLLDDIALYLLQKETITGDELMAYINADNKTLPPAEEAPAAESETPDDPEAPSDTPTES